ncbi:MAG: VOC family protein [Acidobacteria bacterium]|nr:VOC family protein [Acidobacteriota bacterium]
MINIEFPNALQAHIERFDHIAMGVHSVEDSGFIAEVMGGIWKGGGIERDAGFKYAKWDLPMRGQLEMIEPINPNDANNFLNRFLRRRGEGFHHITFKVFDLEAATESAVGAGLVVASTNTDHADWRETFFHPSSTHGIVIQFAQWQDGVGDGTETSLSFEHYLSLQ